MVRVLLLAGGVLWLAGCGSHPRAPALQDQPVYQNDREGFRFLVPEGWKQYARADLPPGKIDHERLLVQYRRKEGKAATLEVSRVDLPASTDLATYLTAPAFGVNTWRFTVREALEVGGKPAERLLLTGRRGAEELTREVVAVRRDERVYLFTGIFASGDAAARSAVRRAVGRVLWKS
jgi:hypothetical protein